MGNNNSNEKIIQHFSMINKQRWFIHDKLKELDYEDNFEMQKIYIEEDQREKYFQMLYNKKSFNSQVDNPKIRYTFKKTFKKLLFKYQTDPWIIKSPHISKKRKIKIHKHTLNKIKEEKMKIINI